MQNVVAPLALLVLFAGPAMADRAVTEAERAKLLSAIAAQGCSAGKLKWDDGDREFEVDDASCSDGKTYDLKFNADYTIKSKKLDD
jgi:hypothetical protein